MAPTAAELFDRYHVRVYRYFRRVTGRHELAQELTQELFLRVVRSLGGYADDGREAAWLFTIARNIALDHQRAARPPMVELSAAGHLAREASQVIAFGVWEALDMLPQQEREMFVLREVVGLSYAEAAEVCGTTADGVRARLFRARNRLKMLLSGRRLHDQSGPRR